MCYLSRGGAERCQAPGSRREDRVRTASLKGRDRGLCGNCRAGRVQVALGPGSGASAPPLPRLLPVPHCFFMLLRLTYLSPSPLPRCLPALPPRSLPHWPQRRHH